PTPPPFPYTTLFRSVGDTLLAVFGVPTLHEDDALRAVGAAAELRKLVTGAGEGPSAVRLDVRIGITTGEVVTIEAGDGPGDVTGDRKSTRLNSSHVA